MAAELVAERLAAIVLLEWDLVSGALVVSVVVFAVNVVVEFCCSCSLRCSCGRSCPCRGRLLRLMFSLTSTASWGFLFLNRCR